MFQTIRTLWELRGLPGLAQVPVDPGVTTPERAALVFSGPQFFIALIAGVVLAFAFQLLLTNLSVAAGISYLGRQSDNDSHDSSQESGSLGGTIRKIGFGVGLWTLVTVSIALFIACLLAVRLSLIISPSLGAIVALVIWATYFCLLVWFSSTTVGSLIGSVINTATSGFQALVGTATAALGAKAVNDQVVATAEAAASAVRRELGSGLDPRSLRHTVEDYLEELRPPELDFKAIRQEFDRLLGDPELKAAAASGSLSNIDRQKFVDLISSRTDFSKQDINRIADQLEGAWRSVVGQSQQRDVNSELLSYLKSARPEELRSPELSRKLDELISEMRQQRQSTQKLAGNQPSGLMDRAMQFASSALLGTVMGRTDLSDLDVEKVWKRIQEVGDQVSSQVSEKAPAALPFNTIKADVDNYLSNAYSWHLNRATLSSEFRDVIYDPEADPNTVRRQLEPLNRAYFTDLLNQRGDLEPSRVSEIVDQLEEIRQEVLTTVRAAQTQEQSQDLRMRIENYLRSSTRADLSAEAIERDFSKLIEDPDAGYDTLQERLSEFDRETLLQVLLQRQDIERADAEQIVAQLENTRNRVLSDSQLLQERAKSETEALQLKIESYLRNTQKDELNPEGIKQDLQKLLDDPQAGALALRSRLAHFDHDTWVQLLRQRQDISEEEANQLVDRMESTWYSVIHAPQIVTGKAKEQYDQTTHAIAQYLRNTQLQELDPDGIRRDLAQLLDDPRGGALALRRRLAEVDRETLVKLLSQPGDLTEAQVNQTIDQLESAIREIVRAPRRWSSRAQRAVLDFEAGLEDYLRNTNKEELNPESIKRDLQLLLRHPRAGMEQWSDRFSRFDRSTVVALLSQRQDMSEEEANRVVDQIESVRTQVAGQIQNIQLRFQGVIDNIFGRIRSYLNSLDRPELNYEGIRRDIRTLFNDPQAGFDALRDRLGHFNRDTLVAVLSSREDISEAQVNRVIDQVENARVSVLQRAERLQQDAQRRLEEVKEQAQKQVEETRKAAETASWWLFGTALVSAIFSAIAGAMAAVAS